VLSRDSWYSHQSTSPLLVNNWKPSTSHVDPHCGVPEKPLPCLGACVHHLPQPSEAVNFIHSVFVCFVWCKEQTVIISVQSINGYDSVIWKQCLHKNQQMHQNYHCIVMLNRRSYMFRRISAIIRELTRSSQAACRCTLQKNNGILSEVAAISNFALWM
jgi:hypothetical protein